MAEANARPIIIKRKIVKGGGHHGGAWKVAYADFVTAMMAFFLLMWLINATTEEQKGGIADYFSPSVPMSEVSAAADGMLNGESILSSEDMADEDSDADMAEIEATLNEQLHADAEPGELTDHLSIRMTNDGLVIEIVDIAERGLFKSGSAAPSVLLRKIIAAIGPIISKARNKIGVSGHTDAAPFASQRSYDNWELSSDRANVARRLLLEQKVRPTRFVSVAGKAASDPVSDDPFAAENRRITITLYHASHYPLEPAASAEQQN